MQAKFYQFNFNIYLINIYMTVLITLNWDPPIQTLSDILFDSKNSSIYLNTSVHLMSAFVTFVITHMLTVYLLSSFNFNLKPDFDISYKTIVITGQGDWILIRKKSENPSTYDLEYFQKCTAIPKSKPYLATLYSLRLVPLSNLTKSSSRVVCLFSN